MPGWEAASDPDEELNILHFWPMGSSYRTIYHGRMRWGRGQYFMGTHPLYILGITAYRVFDRPRVIGGLCILAGYFGAWVGGKPRYEDQEVRRFLRRWQMQELRRRFQGMFRNGKPRAESPHASSVEP
jgi:hypothetical protein